MSAEEQVASLIDEYRQKKLWGSVELEFKEGNLVFIRKKETIYPQEKNSVGPKGSNGSNHQFSRALQPKPIF